MITKDFKIASFIDVTASDEAALSKVVSTWARADILKFPR
jgi:hypothetical protein